MSANSKVTLALFKTSMMALIELWSWSTRPRSGHLVRCFEVSSPHPHCGHLLMMFSSQSESLELQPYQPDTCFVMNAQKVFEYLVRAHLYPSHQTESRLADEMIPFLWKNFLAVDRPQNSSSLDLKEPITFFPPWRSRSAHLGKHFPYTCMCYGLPWGPSLQGYPPWYWFVPSENSLDISLCHQHATARICIAHGMAERIWGFWKCKAYLPVTGWWDMGRGVHSHGKLPHCYHKQPQQEGLRRGIWMLLHSVSIAS